MKKLFTILFILGLIFILNPDTTLAGGCQTTPTDTGKVTLSVTIDKSGEYRVWSRIKAADPTNNSFYVDIDNCAHLVGDAPITADRWTWVDYKDGVTTSKITVNLPVGDHVITLIGNEDGVGVDKLLLTQDLKCVPEGISGDNCPVIPPNEEPDNTPPTITEVRAYDISDTEAKITWQLDEYATGQIEYGTSPSFGSFTNKETSFNYDYHIQSMKNLTPGATYYYRVISADSSGNESISKTCSFTAGGATEQSCESAPVTKPICTQSTIPPETGPAPLTVFLHGSAVAGGTDSLIQGYQWDFDNDGTWDTDIEPEPLSHTYNEPGTYDPKYRILGSNGQYSDLCDYKYQVVVSDPSSPPTVLNFQSVKLHGIGSGGDNSNPNAGGNASPQRTTRDIVVELFDAEGNALSPIEGAIAFISGSGVFSGEIALPEDISTGNYLVKIKSPQYLKEQVSGILNIVKGSETKVPEVSLTVGDLNDDNSITLADYNILVDCYSDLLPAKNCDDSNKKLMADISDDGNVNASDYNLFLRELSVASGD